MAHLREKKGNYYAEFYDPSRQPQRKWKTLRTSDKANARQKLGELERKYALGLFDPWREDPPQEGLTVQEAVDQFLVGRCEKKGLREKTIDNYRHTLGAFADSLAIRLNIRYVDASHIRSYLDRDDLSATSRDTYYRQLKTFFRWCADENIVQDNPIADVTRPGEPEPPPEFLSWEQLQHLLDTIREQADANSPFVGEGEVLWLIDVIKFAVYTGLRRGEICDLRWGAVDLEAGFLTVQETEHFETKTGTEERIPMIDAAKDVLRRKLEERDSDDPSERIFKGVGGGPLNGHYVSERFRHYRKKAELPDEISFHSLRHTCASLLMMEGVPLKTVQAMLRHSRIEVTMKYAHLAPERFKDQIEEGMKAAMEGGER
ncbi:tyrosine-type recombinase/integrase [Salinibacter sp.]|uniref:tyrosine-type recombinase/integrase n=1 Tax=Salinibacter sp. TaxID=2065818 RepID=UPI0021E78228|nr:site-specific integrase [Salinibacter sp.]